MQIKRGKWKWTKNTGMRIIGSYIRSWERPGDLPRVIEFLGQVNFMWCVFHNAQWYWSDNLCKLVTDQWRGSLGVRV
jgi:hypothetical protein